MEIDSPEKLRQWVLGIIEDYDFDALAEDVGHFLLRQNEQQRVILFKSFWEQVNLG